MFTLNVKLTLTFKLGSPACHYKPPCMSNLRTVGPSILKLSIG